MGVIIDQPGYDQFAPAIIDFLSACPCLLQGLLALFHRFNPFVLDPDIHVFLGDPFRVNQGDVVK